MAHLELIGWIGSVCLGICALPQAIQCYKEKHADGISHGLVWLWYIGELFTLIYIVLTNASIPLILNYSVNLLLLHVILYYKYVTKRSSTCLNRRPQ